MPRFPLISPRQPIEFAVTKDSLGNAFASTQMSEPIKRDARGCSSASSSLSQLPVWNHLLLLLALNLFPLPASPVASQVALEVGGRRVGSVGSADGVMGWLHCCLGDQNAHGKPPVSRSFGHKIAPTLLCSCSFRA